MRLALAALAAVSVFAFQANSETATPPIEAYGKLPTVMDAEMSPDGSRVALLVGAGGSPAIIIFEDNAGITAKYDVSALNADYVSFGDKDHLLIGASMAARGWRIRRQYENSGAVSLSLKDGSSHQMLMREKRLYPTQTGLGKVVGILASGEALMPAFIGDPRSRQEPDYDLMRVDIASGRVRDFAVGTEDTIDWFVDNDGKLLIRENYDNDNDHYLLERREGRGWEPLLEETADEIPIGVVAVAPDDSGIYFISTQDEEDGYTALSKMNLDGSIEHSQYYREGADIDHVITDKNRHLVGVRYSGMLPSYELLKPELTQSLEAVKAQFPNAMVELDSWAEDYSKVLYRVFDGFRVDYWVTHEPATNAYKLLSYARDDIPPEAIGPVATIEYPSRDGLTIPAVVTLPPGKQLTTDLNLPLIVLPHGGPKSYDSFDFDWMSQYFANRGYIVLQPNFRGSTGFGYNFTEAGSGEWGGKMQDDITDGVNALTEGGFADPDRVCIVGASYGGYAALAGGAFTPELYDCVAAIAPVTDLNAMMIDTQRESGRDHWAVSYWARLMADGDSRREKLDAISPAKHPEAFAAPVLLIHGEDDTVVGISQSLKMERALNSAGKPVQMIKLKGGDHWLRDSDTRLQTLQALDTFVSSQIGDGAP